MKAENAIRDEGTLYKQGNAVGTERHSGVLISMMADASAGVSGILTSTLASAGTKLSSTTTVYDALGRVVETIDAAGLRTGTIYYDNGQVHYTGPLADSVSDKGTSPWYTTSLPSDPAALATYLSNLFVSDTSYVYDQTQYSNPNFSKDDAGWTIKLVNVSQPVSFDESVDALGHGTRTYRDITGREVETLYADDTYTATYYSTPWDSGDGDVAQAVSAPDDWNNSSDGTWGLTAADGWSGNANDGPSYLPDGYSEVVKVAQRKRDADNGYQHEPVLATIELYDPAGRLVDVWLPAVADALNGGAMKRPHWHYEYDANGNEIEQVDPKGNVTMWTYDDQGRETSRTLPGDKTEWNFYDNTTPTSNFSSSTGYGELAFGVDFDGHITQYLYDNTASGAGRLVTKNYYDSFASPLTISATTTTADVASDLPATATQTVSYSYDALGRQSTVTDVSGTTTDHYDSQGNLTEEDTPEGTIHYVYDPATNRHVETYTDSTDTQYGYNQLGQLRTVTVNKLNGSTLTTPFVTTYNYDAVGNTTSVASSDGTEADYTYDSLNRLTDVADQKDGVALFSQHYVLADDGKRIEDDEVAKNTDGSAFSTTTITWGYDNDGRLTSETDTSSLSDHSFADTFTYDLNGNRMEDDHTGPGGGASDTITYAYNGRDELTAENSTLNGETDYSYDDNGSQTDVWHRTPDTHDTYNYDVRNRLSSATVGGVTSTYVYDDAGNRVKETTSGTTTYYVTDDRNPTGYAQVLEEKTSPTATPTITYVLGDRALAQADNAGVISTLLADGHGSTRLLVTASAAPVRFDYSAFGGAIGFGLTSAPTEHLFGGDAVLDRGTGLYLHGNGIRKRDGFRFIQMDDPGYGSNGDPLSLHTYLYTPGDPVMYVDPSAHFSITGILTVMGIGGVLGGLINAVSHAALNQVHTVTDAVRAFEVGFATGALIAPVAVAFPGVGLGLAVYGLYNSADLAWHVYTSPISTQAERLEALSVLGVSVAGVGLAGTNVQANGWGYNPAAFTGSISDLFGILRDEGLGDLTQDEIAQIQRVVDKAGVPLKVGGSAARGARGPGSDIDYVVSPEDYQTIEPFAHELPSIDPSHGVLIEGPTQDWGAGILFLPGGAPKAL